MKFADYTTLVTVFWGKIASVLMFAEYQAVQNDTQQLTIQKTVKPASHISNTTHVYHR
jgi:hypothetical protein